MVQINVKRKTEYAALDNIKALSFTKWHTLNIAFYEQSVNIKCTGNSNLCQYYKNFMVREELSVHFLPSALYGDYKLK